MNVARIAALLLLGFVTSSSAFAQPRQPVRILAGFPPGGNVDILARVFAERLTEANGGRPTIVINKVGAGGQIAAETLKEATPDGKVLLKVRSHADNRCASCTVSDTGRLDNAPNAITRFIGRTAAADGHVLRPRRLDRALHPA